ncbi:MAG: mevalonate kinase family protein [Pseudomonadota bacterium]
MSLAEPITPPLKWQSVAPANSMILGEHSVVYGHPAMACALNQFIYIDWQSRPDYEIHIHSALAEHSTQIQSLLTQKQAIHPQLKFVCHALAAFAEQLPFGLTIHIRSEFSSTIGLGSSAAVLAAMLSGLNQITQQHKSLLELFAIGHSIILKIQGRGSGTDLAASLSGGVIYFQPHSAGQPPEIKSLIQLNQAFPVTLIYAGYKTPTAQVLELVAKQWQTRPAELSALYQQMGQTTLAAFKALQQQNLPLFYHLFKTYQALMTQLGVNDATLSLLIEALSACASIEAAKISGSGFGDCVIGLGTLDQCPDSSKSLLANYQQLQVNITLEGAKTRTISC